MTNKNYNTTALAFMGDAVYEVYVRQRVMMSGQPAADKLHRMAVKAMSMRRAKPKPSRPYMMIFPRKNRPRKTGKKPKDGNKGQERRPGSLQMGDGL